MKKLLMICFTLGLIAVVGGCSCKTNKFEIAYEGKGGFGFDEDKLTYCISEYISTKEELKALSKKLNNGYFDELSTSYNSNIGLIIRNYDDIFFNDNNLIVCVINGANSYDYSVNKLDVSNNKLIINIKKTQKKGTFTDEAFSYLFIIEVEKKEFLNINYVETIIKLKDCSLLEEEKYQEHHYFISVESQQYISFTDSLKDLKFYIIQNYNQFNEFILENDIKEIYYDEYNNINYNENLTYLFTEEFFKDNALILISYYTETSLDDLTVIKSYYFENGILNIKFGVPKSDFIPTNSCYLLYTFKCNKQILSDLVSVEYEFGVKN